MPLLRRLDWTGLITLAAFLGSLEYVLEEGARKDWFNDQTIAELQHRRRWSSAIAFFWRALTAAEPIVDLRAFADRNFATGSLFSFVLGVGLYGLVFLLPIFLARVRGYDALEIGDTMFVTGVFMMLTAPIAGGLAPEVDPRMHDRHRPRALRALLLRAGAGHQGLGVLGAVRRPGAARLRH